MSLLDYHEPESWRFYVYGEDDEGDPLYSFWMNIDPNTGVCLYDRPGDAGKWLETGHETDEYVGVKPTAGLGEVLEAAIVDERGVHRDQVESLPPHEQHFARTIIGTAEQRGHLPAEILTFMEQLLGRSLALVPAGDAA